MMVLSTLKRWFQRFTKRWERRKAPSASKNRSSLQNPGVREVDRPKRDQARKETRKRKLWRQQHSQNSVPENQSSGQSCSSPLGSWRLRFRSRLLGGSS